MLGGVGSRSVDAAEIIDLLGSIAHPEGGWYRETWRSDPMPGDPDGRAAGTAIYFLLVADEWSHWHKVVDADEIWHHYAGAPLELWISPDGREP